MRAHGPRAWVRVCTWMLLAAAAELDLARGGPSAARVGATRAQATGHAQLRTCCAPARCTAAAYFDPAWLQWGHARVHWGGAGRGAAAEHHSWSIPAAARRLQGARTRKCHRPSLPALQPTHSRALSRTPRSPRPGTQAAARAPYHGAWQTACWCRASGPSTRPQPQRRPRRGRRRPRKRTRRARRTSTERLFRHAASQTRRAGRSCNKRPRAEWKWHFEPAVSSHTSCAFVS